MARGRTEPNRGGCGKTATIVLVLVVLVGLGYAFLGNRGVENLFGVDVERLFESYVTDAFENSPYSTEGIFRAVETAGWSRTGGRGTIQQKGRSVAVQTFSREGDEVRLEIAELESREAASKYASSVEQPRRAVQFERKVAVLQPRGSTDSQAVAGLVEHLRRYRRMVTDDR